MLPPCDVTFAVPHCLSSFIRPIVLVSPLPRFYFCQRFFFPSHPSDPLILPVQNFSFTLSCGCSRAVFLKFLFPAQHSNSLFFLSLSPALGVHQAAYVSSLPLLMTVLHQVPRHDSAIFWLALKATRELWLFPFAANSPYRQSNLTFLFSLQSTNFIKISIAHASTQSHLRLSVSSISWSLLREFPSLLTLLNSKLFTEPTPTRLFRTPPFWKVYCIYIIYYSTIKFYRK